MKVLEAWMSGRTALWLNLRTTGGTASWLNPRTTGSATAWLNLRSTRSTASSPIRRMLCGTKLSVVLLFCLCAAPYHGAMPEPRQPHTSRQDLIGAWRLVSIQLIGPRGRANDPFYNADPSGVLIYDASGWMSVQIAGQPRPSMEAPASRPVRPRTLESAQREAAVLDTYYAYAGTWEFDAATSTVTHHITTSLIPAEVGMSYSQTVTVDDGKLTFTRREAPGGATVQEKVWKRLNSATD